jgi:hypothetical protein
VRDENHNFTDVEVLPSGSSDDEFKSRFAVVLDKLEQLPAVMTITQLLSNSSHLSLSTSSDSGSEEKASAKEAPLFRPVSVDALRLIELTERASAVMMSAESDYILQTDPLVSVFRTFGTLNRVPVKAHISVVSYDEFPNSVARHVEHSSSQMLLVPLKITGNDETTSSSGFNPFDNLFKRTITTNSSSEAVNSHYIRKIFAGTKADVCLIIDRGLSTSGTPSDRHIFLPFFGGPDDRLALSLVVQFCAGDHGVTASVVRIRKTSTIEPSEKIEDLETLHNVGVFHWRLIETLTTIIIFRLYSLTPFTATNPLRPASHPIQRMTLSGVDIPLRYQTQPFARPPVGLSSAKRTLIVRFTLSKPSPRHYVPGGC